MKSNASQNPIRFFTLVGVAVAVLVRLKHVPTPPNERLPKDLQVSLLVACIDHIILTKPFQTEIASIYTSTVVMSKTTVPTHILVRPILLGSLARDVTHHAHTDIIRRLHRYLHHIRHSQVRLPPHHRKSSPALSRACPPNRHVLLPILPSSSRRVHVPTRSSADNQQLQIQ